MINTPTQKDKKATLVSCTVFVLSLALALCAGLVLPSYKSILQFSGFALFIIATQMLVRYTLSSFSYEISFTEEENSLIVVKKYSVRKTVECNLDVSTGEDVIKLERGQSLPDELKKNRKVYNYCVSMFPDVKYAYLFEFNENEYVIYLECDEAFAGKLREAIADAKNKL